MEWLCDQFLVHNISTGLSAVATIEAIVGESKKQSILFLVNNNRSFHVN